MKIGLLTTQNQLNYGAVLQAYALASILRLVTRKCQVETVNFWFFEHNSDLAGVPWGLLVKFWRKAVLKRYLIRLLMPGQMRSHKKRRTLTMRFLDEFVGNGKTLYENPNDLWRKGDYNLFVVGSDQVWRYQSRIHEFSLLPGDNRLNPKKIAYAASLGWKTLPQAYHAKFYQNLMRFDYISVREPSAVEVLSTFLGGKKTVAFCLDPTILFGRSRWGDFLAQHRKNKLPADRYVFVYWTKDILQLDSIFQGLHDAGYRTIQAVVPWYMRVVAGKIMRIKRFMKKASRDFGVCWNVGAGPLEFLDMIADAELVVASSFHAMMFSLIFHKPARIFVKIDQKNDFMAPRMLDFAERYSVNDVVYEGLSGNCDFSLIIQPDYSAIWEKIDQDRHQSMEFLLESLKRCEVEVSKKICEVH